MSSTVTQKQLSSYRRFAIAGAKARKLGATIKAAILAGSAIEPGKLEAELVDVSKGVDWKEQFIALCEENGMDAASETATIAKRCRRKTKRLCVTTFAG